LLRLLLLAAFAATVTGAGGQVLAGRGYEAEGLRPYGAWTDALAGAADGSASARA